ncbi:hypothetical protein K239x_52600 [Planctomycetes bacterium K23_9]|uniref:Uncharacterized protein n=1 Tax=Stieleria marina TaxID=1930275 RepID=A0A517P1L6_9BACT|nr:hypothetical protein K239x_52600 [Planctomycetes bacterium K23_9]
MPVAHSLQAMIQPDVDPPGFDWSLIELGQSKVLVSQGSAIDRVLVRLRSTETYFPSLVGVLVAITNAGLTAKSTAK